MINLAILVGVEVTIFEKDGFETETGIISNVKDGFLYLEYSNCIESGTLKIPINSVKLEVNLTTKANSLNRYKIKDV